MPRRTLVLALLVVGASAVAAESTVLPVADAVKEARPATKQAAGAAPKPVERKAAEAPKNSPGDPKTSPPVFEEKNLGLGCAQG